MELTGIGLYSLAEAARLTGADARDIKRWLFGYRYRPTPGAKHKSSDPLWEPEVHGYDVRTIGFHDLMELRFVSEFVRHGVHLLVVREAAKAARELFGTRYPFTTLRFKTDGRTIFHDAVERTKGELIDLPKRQLAFDEVIRPSLYAGIEFRGDGSAMRWYPVQRSKVIVLDPEVSFGTPTLDRYGIPTATIHAEYEANGENKAFVARLFNIPPQAVEAAVRFEQRKAA